MTQKEIVDGSKLIANYIGWQYIPFDNLQGYSKPGWWAVKKVNGEGDLFEYISMENKNHKSKIGCRNYICRNHGELRFWNSLDALIPVIQKIEKEDNAVFELRQNGCTVLKWALRLKGGNNSFDLPNWSNNVFKVIVKYLETK